MSLSPSAAGRLLNGMAEALPIETAPIAAVASKVGVMVFMMKSPEKQSEPPQLVCHSNFKGAGI
jgi:hypothetical protein